MKPILFNTEMVRAILDGRKTTTRRVIKPQPSERPKCDPKGRKPLAFWTTCDDIFQKWIKPPYQPGDDLYVRETWNDNPEWFYENKGPHFLYKASNMGFTGGWRPLTHMPKEAARIFLRVTDVKAEHLQGITSKEAIAEGVGDLFLDDCAYDDKYKNIPWVQKDGLSVHQFARLWDTTVKKSDRDKYGWDANPWVWVICFQHCEKPR